MTKTDNTVAADVAKRMSLDFTFKDMPEEAGIMTQVRQYFLGLIKHDNRNQR